MFNLTMLSLVWTNLQWRFYKANFLHVHRKYPNLDEAEFLFLSLRNWNKHTYKSTNIHNMRDKHCHPKIYTDFWRFSNGFYFYFILKIDKIGTMNWQKMPFNFCTNFRRFKSKLTKLQRSHRRIWWPTWQLLPTTVRILSCHS